MSFFRAKRIIHIVVAKSRQIEFAEHIFQSKIVLYYV